jgi:hypothetical protein
MRRTRRRLHAMWHAAAAQSIQHPYQDKQDAELSA